MFKKSRRTALLTASLLIAIAVPIIAVPNAQAALPDTVHLTVHYQRSASDYPNWNIYLWRDLPGSANDKEVSAAGFPFTSNDSYGAVATIDVTGMAAFNQLGFIVRKGAWVEKDVGTDRFVPAFNANGNAEIWLRQGDSVVYTAPPTGVIAANPVVLQAKIYDSADFAAKYTYSGSDLGNTYTASNTKFRVWAPTATKVSLLTYPSLTSPDSAAKEIPMTSDVNGTWITTLDGDQNGLVYMYRVTVDGATNDAVDP